MLHHNVPTLRRLTDNYKPFQDVEKLFTLKFAYERKFKYAFS